jgi:crotonobetainyl-CoA:carnitine CoA-transferase CaiB-like acyl-CoA transferase
MAEKAGPLDGLTVIELGTLIAGPFCGQLLGDLGAEVIKIEPPGLGDPMRAWGQVKAKGEPMGFALIARNKRCATLDLRKPEGQKTLLALAAKADFVVENFRPGTMEKWGIGYEQLAKINPGIIMVRVSGYGQTGPNAKKAGYAAVGEAFGGLRYVMGEPDRRPSRAGISLGDSLAATFACVGALAALEARHKTGRGQIVDSAIYEAVLAMMESLIPEYQLAGFVRERSGSVLANVAPSNIYETSDGMIIVAANQDSVFARLAEVMGKPELASDPRFKDHHARGANQVLLDDMINDWSRNHSSAELQALCDAGGVPCGPLYRAPEMLKDPHYKAREAIVSVDHPHFGAMLMQSVFPKLSMTPGKVRWAGHALGEDNDYVWLEKLGMKPAEYDALKKSGVI